MNVICNYGLYHDKAVNKDGSASSDNGYIYTAYAMKLGLPIDLEKVEEVYSKCLFIKPDGSLMLNRLPYMKEPPFSIDEVLGLSAMKILGLHDTIVKDWHFCPFVVPKFNLFKFISQLMQMIPTFKKKHFDDAPLGKYMWRRHRCFFWQHELDQMYNLAFMVTFTARHFLLVNDGSYNKFKPSHIIYRLIAKVDSMLPLEDGIRWLKYGKSLEGMRKEFPVGHPFLD